jgi:hypothetical protein
MKIANLKVSAALLADVLRLPHGTEIVECRMDSTSHSAIALRIVHDDLDEVKPGELIPTVDVAIHTPHSTFVKYS